MHKQIGPSAFQSLETSLRKLCFPDLCILHVDGVEQIIIVTLATLIIIFAGVVFDVVLGARQPVGKVGLELKEVKLCEHEV